MVELRSPTFAIALSFALMLDVAARWRLKEYAITTPNFHFGIIWFFSMEEEVVEMKTLVLGQYDC